MRPCKTPGCPGRSRGYGWCDDCRAQWKAGTLLPAQRPMQVAYLPPSAAPTPETATDAGQRCASCSLLFPLLVDGVLCISCDSLHYPAAVAS